MTYKFNTAEYPVLTSEDEKKYIFVCKSSNSNAEKQEAIDKLVYHNMGLVYSCINKMNFKGTSCRPDDLVSYGVEALIKAISKYDAESEARFSTYAYMRVMKKVIEGYRENTKLISLPDYIWDGLMQFTKAMDKFKKENNVDATYLPFSDENNGVMSDMERILATNAENPMKLSTYKNVVAAYQNGWMESLDVAKESNKNDKTISLIDTIEDKSCDNGSNDILATLENEFINIAALSKGDKIVEVLRLKLQGMKSSEIQRKLGLTRAVENGLEKKGMQYLQNSAELKQLWSSLCWEWRRRCFMGHLAHKYIRVIE